MTLFVRILMAALEPTNTIDPNLAEAGAASALAHEEELPHVSAVSHGHLDYARPDLSWLPNHIPSLDGLRAISIIFVIVAHSAGTRNAPAALDYLLPFGNLGVKIFFEISGFLITTLLLKELTAAGRVSFSGFYWRRVLRIFPAFYAYIAIICTISALGLIRLKSGDLFHAITFTMNYHHERAWYLNHLWSLSVEEQFYILWPALLCWSGARRSIPILIGVMVAAPFIRTAMVLNHTSPTALTREFQAVADALAAGCLLALCYKWLGTKRAYVSFLSSPLFFVVIIAGFLLPLKLNSIKPALFYTMGQSIAHVCIALCIDRCVRFPDRLAARILNLRPLAFIGLLSYSLYLWQEPFLLPGDQSRAWASAFPLNIGCAVLAALASYYLIERPFLKLKNRGKSRAQVSSRPVAAAGIV